MASKGMGWQSSSDGMMRAGKKISSAIQGITDKLTGTSRIDNSTDPTSALSMARRKAATRTAPTSSQVKGLRPQ